MQAVTYTAIQIYRASAYISQCVDLIWNTKPELRYSQLSQQEPTHLQKIPFVLIILPVLSISYSQFYYLPTLLMKMCFRAILLESVRSTTFLTTFVNE